MRTREVEEPPPPPFNPEPMDVMRARFQYVATGRLQDMHSFDFRDGLRIVVIRNPKWVGYTMSARWWPGSEMAFTMVGRLRSARNEAERDAVREAWDADVIERFRDLSGCTGRVDFIGNCPDWGIPHWFVS